MDAVHTFKRPERGGFPTAHSGISRCVHAWKKGLQAVCICSVKENKRAQDGEPAYPWTQNEGKEGGWSSGLKEERKEG